MNLTKKLTKAQRKRLFERVVAKARRYGYSMRQAAAEIGCSRVSLYQVLSGRFAGRTLLKVKAWVKYP